jgi:hypothetical protein
MGMKHVNDTWWGDPVEPVLTPLSTLGCDDFECALLAIIRDLTLTCRHPEQQTWVTVYGAAGKRWGVRTGLPLVHGLSQIVVALLRVTGGDVHILDETDDFTRTVATRDEQLLLLMIHQLRRNHLQAGCDFLLDLLHGQMDADLMQQVLAFAQRHSCGRPQTRRHDGVLDGHLRVVR